MHESTEDSDSATNLPSSTHGTVDRATALDLSASLQMVSDLAGLLSWEYVPAKQSLRWPPQSDRLLGFTLPPTLKDFLVLVHPDDQNELKKTLRSWARQGQRFDAEHRILNPDTGEIIWLRSRGTMLNDGEGQERPRLVGITQNISADKALERNALFLADLQHNLATLQSTDTSLGSIGERILDHLDLSGFSIHDVSAEDNALCTIHEQHRHKSDPAGPVRRLSDHFSPEIRCRLAQGTHVTIEDDASSIVTSASSTSIHLPHLVEGRWQMMFSAHREHPSAWESKEIEFLAEITERLCLRITHARIEQDLRRSEDHYRTLFESIDEGFCVIEMLRDETGTPNDFRFLEVNPAFQNQSGIDDAVGKRMKQIAPGHESHWFEKYGAVALTGTPMRFIAEARDLGRWYDVHAFRVGDPTLLHVAVLFTDITHRKHTEDMLRESEARVHRAMEIDSVGILYFQPDGLVTYANQAFMRMSGYTNEDVQSGQVRWDTMTPPEWMPNARRAIVEFLSLGRIAPYEKEYVRKDGTRWWGLFAASRISEEEGVKYIIDITDSKQAEVDRARLADIVEDSNDAIVRCKPDGTIVDVNHAATELYGYSAERMIGLNIMDTSPADHQHEFAENYARLTCGDPVPPWETVRRRADGTELQVEIRMSPIRDIHGDIVGCSGIIRDVTERKRLEQAQEDFLAMASHDLRSPVTVLLGRAQLMRRRKAYDDASIRTIIDQARRIERLTSDLQQVVHLESGKLKLIPTHQDLSRLAIDAVNRLSVSAPGVEVKAELPPEPVIGVWDHHRLSQVIDNLLLNAIKYSPEQGAITVRVSGDQETAQLSVADHGVGITPELQKRLFTRFYRADEAGIASGLGLGLYISRILVEAHGGTIKVDSRPGIGSVFTIKLPRGAKRA